MKWPGGGRIGTVIAVEVLALLAFPAAPAIREAGSRRLAQGVAADVRVVLAAATQAQKQSGVWPEDEEAGHLPAPLAPFLPRGFTFERSEYSLDWDHWRLSDGTETFSTRGEFVGVSVIVRDPRISRQVVGLLSGERGHFTIGNRSTVPISDPRLPTP